MQTCRYGILGRETAPTTGTEHIQGYINLNHAREFSAIKQAISTRSHVELARGNDHQNRTYCCKSGTFEEFGNLPPGQGARTDLQNAIHDLLDDRQDMVQVARANPAVYVRYHRGLVALRDLLVPVTPRTTRTCVNIFVGPTRTGKSQLAHDIAEHHGTVYYKNRSTWWHNYQQEHTVVLDDFYGWLKWDELLKICDRYPYKVETKGGWAEFTSKLIIITSNSHPDNWYKFGGYDSGPILSDRICSLVEFLPGPTYNTTLFIKSCPCIHKMPM